MSPIPVRQYSKGKTGIAMISTRDDKLDVTFEDNKQTVTVLLRDAPDYIRDGRQAVTLNSSNTEIFGARPILGTYKVKFLGFAGKESEPPTIRTVAAKSGVTKEGKKYNIKQHLEFTAIFVITAGKWKNYQIVYNLPYSFEKFEDEERGKTITLVYGEKVTKFLQLCGLDFSTDSIPWSENVLVYLNKLLGSRDKVFAISLNDQGWVKDLSELPDDEEEDSIPAGAAVANAPEPVTQLEISGEQNVIRIMHEDDLKLETPVAKEEPKKLVTEEEPKKPEPTTKPASNKKSPSAPTILDILANNAKAGDQDSLNMLSSLANTNPEAKKRLLEIAQEQLGK